MANNGKPDFPDIPPISESQREYAKKHDILKNIGDALDGKLENPNGQNLTFYIDLKFKKPNFDEATEEAGNDASGNSTIPENSSNLTDISSGM